MNPTTVSYYVFGGLFLCAILWIVRKRYVARQEQQELEARLGVNPSAEPVATAAPVEPAAVTPVAASTTEPVLPPSPWDKLVQSQPVPREVPPLEADASIAAKTTINADKLTPWTPPEPKVWQPTPETIYRVSWSNHALFGKEVNDFDEGNTIPKVTPDQVPSADTSDYAFGTLTPAMAGVIPTSDAVRVEKELRAAGYFQPHAMQNLAATRFAIAFAAFLICGTVLLLVPRQLELFAMGALLLVPSTLWAAPRILVQNKAAARKSELERSMPDMLDMLNMCVSQGLTIPQSLKRISKDLKPVYPVLAAELGIVVHQAEVGNLRVALDNFSERVDVPEVDSFTTLMNQSERMGTSISDALTEYSNTMRESLRQRTDEKANKASFKLMFPTVLFMMPAVFMFLMGPAILELQTFFDNGGMNTVTQGAETMGNVNNITR